MHASASGDVACEVMHGVSNKVTTHELPIINTVNTFMSGTAWIARWHEQKQEGYGVQYRAYDCSRRECAHKSKSNKIQNSEFHIKECCPSLSGAGHHHSLRVLCTR
eukprot:m.321535 g.321535  ORF g.321535 m.321535 type:complete len:106 (-) comp15999_c0_seq2:603-920(-)